jgi:1,4-alpha-glucan branching enzyme
MMNWPEIEAVVYSETNHPHEILGAHPAGTGSLLQTFQPGATKVMATVRDANDPYKLATYKMSLADEEGFFACLVPGKKVDCYTLTVTYSENEEKEINDAYAFSPDFISDRDIERFSAGIHYTIYEKLGAHPKTIRNVAGTTFAVWAPGAVRVSVVGDFNAWDGRIHQMQRLGDSGIFAIFIPGVSVGDLYKYELKVPGGLVYLKSDPYAFGQQLRPDTASVVRGAHRYSFDDAEWMSIRAARQGEEAPINIYELHLGSFRQHKADDSDTSGHQVSNNKNNTCYLNYRELAPLVIEHVREMRYTHIQLMPQMEHYDDDSCGFLVTGFYAPTARHGDAADFAYFVNEMHRANIGVIAEWVPAYFSAEDFALMAFDGTCLYEHLDPRQGRHPYNGAYLFNYGRPEVSNFLLANALYWLEKFHLDGIKIGDMAAMLYLDYGKSEGEWIANIYGSNENLEAVEFLKHLSSMVHGRNPGVLLIGEEKTGWPKLTTSLKKGGLGFSFKWNNGWLQDFLRYLEFDPYFRAHHHPELTFSMIYAYSERFMVAISHEEVSAGKPGLIGRMPGHIKDKFANLRLAYAYQIMHPGKKLLCMGQDLAAFSGFEASREVKWSLLEHEEHQNLNQLCKELNDFYRKNPALFVLDHDPAGFKWISCIAADKCMLSFMRKSRKQEETLYIIANFANVRQSFDIGVMNDGKYREVLNTDEERFGGGGRTNKKALITKEYEVDDFPYAFTMVAAPLSLSVFTYEPFSEKERETRRKRRETQIKQRLAEEKAAVEEKVMAEIMALEKEINASKAAAKQRISEEISRAEQKAAAELDRLFSIDHPKTANIEKLKAGKIKKG